ncbi:MAG: hypothetical protein AAGA90_13750 [Actinomycetota bacterium]
MGDATRRPGGRARTTTSTVAALAALLASGCYAAPDVTCPDRGMDYELSYGYGEPTLCVYEDGRSISP